MIMNSIDARALELLTPKGFVNRFFELLPHCETHEQAYEMVESQHLAAFQNRKYKSFDSFRVVRDRLKHKPE
jgi:hypothetical protein